MAAAGAIAPQSGVANPAPLTDPSKLGAKAIAERGLLTIPENYVWPESLRPTRPCGSKPQNGRIPVIDLAELEGEGRAGVVEEIGRACQEWGFFQVLNHGVPSALTKSVLDVALQFFMLPIEEKMRYHSDNMYSSSIYFGTSFNPSVDDVLSWRDFLRHSCHPLQEFIHIWPDKPTSYRVVASEYCKEVRALASRLFAAISESLGVAPDYIEKAFDESSQIMLLNYYPPCVNPDVALGLASHSDSNGLTILLPDQEVPGLQVRHKGHWIDVTPIKDALVVNVADQIQILTNGRYESVEHRALVNSTRSRMSIATFFGPSMHKVIAPAMEFVDEKNPPKYKPAKYSDYLQMLLNRGIHGKAMVESRENLD